MWQLVDVNTFDYEWFRGIKPLKRKRGNQGTKEKRSYINAVCAFDIETSRIKEIEQSFMYIWQFQVDEKFTVVGRYWEEFLFFLNSITGHLQHNEYIVVYVHNLSYEFQFLRGIYDFATEEVFAVDRRKVLKCDMLEHIEFRCSYLHSNMSLGEYTKKMKVEHVKLSGDDFNYDIVRYPWTELTKEEMDYCVNDVRGLVEALKTEMLFDGDNLYTIPITSTGYVRRDAKKAMRDVSHTFVKDQLPDYEIYQMLREAFRGGNTHANRYYANHIIDNVNSADRSSSYPDVQCNCEYPVSKFTKVGIQTYAEVKELMDVRHKAVLMRVSLTKVRLIDEYWGCPYLSKDKSRKIQNALYDNGRILSADYMETTITDIDLRIILSEYTFDDIAFFDVAYARYGKLPRSLIQTTISYYKTKTELKNVAGQEIYYNKDKNKLNAIYGMSAQDPVKQSIDFIDNDFVEREDDERELLEKSNQKAFMCYQWGVWVTAWARYRLEEGIRLAGDNFVYCDTDSVKYVGNIDWTAYNNERIDASKKSGAYATDPKGVTHYMGVFEMEKGYKQFVTMGAKKYCVVYHDGKLEITVAGVNKHKGAFELEMNGGITAFKSGFCFYYGGGTESVYNDSKEVIHYEVDGHTLDITSNVVIRDSTYTLGLTHDYKRLLELSTIELKNISRGTILL